MAKWKGSWSCSGSWPTDFLNRGTETVEASSKRDAYRKILRNAEIEMRNRYSFIDHNRWLREGGAISVYNLEELRVEKGPTGPPPPLQSKGIELLLAWMVFFGWVIFAHDYKELIWPIAAVLGLITWSWFGLNWPYSTLTVSCIVGYLFYRFH
jgi:hypothetical protein